MRSKFIIFIAIVIAVLTSICMLGDDSDGMGVSGSLQYDGVKYGPLTLEAGTYYFEVDYSIYLEYAPGMTKQINNYGAVTLSEQYDCFMTLDHWDNPSSIPYTYYAVKEYDVANDYWSSFEMSATKFPVAAGWMDYYIRPVDENYSYYNGYKINIGNEYIYLNSGVGRIYIPFDCDVAYISTDNYWDYMDYDVYFSYEIVKDSYEYTSNLYKSYEEYNKIHLDVGTYTFEFSRDGRLDYSESSSIFFEFATAEEKNITVTEAGFYYFNPNNLYVHDYDALVPIYYNMSPAPSSDPIQTDVEHDDISSSTVYRWYKGEFDLSSGDHNLYARNSYNYNWCFIKGSTEEIDFVNDIIRANVVSVDHNYPSLGTSFALDSAATIVMYSLVKEYLIEDIEYRVDNNDSDVVPELFYGGEDYEAVYVGANDEVKIGATYDSKKHVLFLVSFDEMIMLPCGEYINVSTVAAKEYDIIAIPLVINDISCFEVEYQLYTEGVPKSDSLAPLFAAVSIGLCAVFFGLLFISGRKPKWKD